MDENNINKNNGDFIAKIWGPPLWFSLHALTFYYPEIPCDKEKKKYKKFFKLLGDMLPCSYCKESYNEFIKKGITKLDDSVFKNRESLTKWLYYIHESVNKKLGVDYGISYDDVVKKYESFRIACIKNDKIETKGCEIPMDSKMKSFKIAFKKECPIIPIKMAKHFIKYGRMRGINEKDFYIINNNNTRENICKNTELWEKRNKECSEIIRKMREDGIKSLEINGEWKDLPTKEELKLIMRLSSNLSKEKLIEIIKKLPQCKCEYKRIYKLIT